MGGRDLIPGNIFGSHGYPDGLGFVAARAQGSRIWATDGREFIDYVIGSGPMIIGHAHPHVAAAIAKQAALGTHLYAMNEVALALAEKINQHVPNAEAMKFVADGAQATFYSMRLARAFTGRSKILKFEGGYHGHHDYAMHGLTVSPGENNAQRKADSAGVPADVSGTVLVAPFNDLAATEAIVKEHGADLACIIVEPVQRSIPPLPGFLPGLRKICDRVGAMLIFDELVTGFRIAFGGAQEAYGVKPDLCAMGKIIGGGLPLAAVVGRRDLIELTVPGRPNDGRSVFFSGTLNGNPLACAAGLATLEVLEEQDGPAKVAAAGTKLAKGFREQADRLSIPFQMVGPPSFAEPVFGSQPVTNYAQWGATNQAASKQFSAELMKRGHHVLFVAKYYLSTAHTDSDIDATVSAAYEAMRAVRDGGYLDKAQ
jgi:glutamate-1-semialdehyde 2,1-aminomutase